MTTGQLTAKEDCVMVVTISANFIGELKNHALRCYDVSSPIF